MSEYQPVTNLEESRQKLQVIANTQLEVPDKTLFEAIVDVLASRAGERWKKLDELWLSTRPNLSMKVVVGFNDLH